MSRPSPISASSAESTYEPPALLPEFLIGPVTAAEKRAGLTAAKSVLGCGFHSHRAASIKTVKGKSQSDEPDAGMIGADFVGSYGPGDVVGVRIQLMSVTQVMLPVVPPLRKPGILPRCYRYNCTAKVQVFECNFILAYVLFVSCFAMDLK